MPTSRFTWASRPEKKIGPFRDGLAVDVWLNSVETIHGRQWFRNITISPRRYRDRDTGEWRSAVSYRPIDLATLELALAEARRYCQSATLPGPKFEGDELA